MSTDELDAGRAHAFAARMVGLVDDAMLGLLVSIGHRTGLFDVMAGLGWADSAEIADAAGLHERYVREWLGAMVTGGIVAYDPRSRCHRLPREHAASLTTAAGLANLAALCQLVAVLGKVEDGVVASFREGGGVPAARFRDYERLVAEASGRLLDATLLGVVVPLVPSLPGRLEAGIDVADVACRSGHAVNLLARAYPGSRFLGYGRSPESVAVGVAEAAAWGLRNARFEHRDPATLGGPPAFDLVTTFDAVHDQAQPARVLRGIFEVLRPGGTFLCAEVRASSDLAGNLDHPFGPFLYAVSCLHCTTTSLAVGGAALGAMWGKERALQLLAEAGFTDVRAETVPGDLIHTYYVASRP